MQYHEDYEPLVSVTDICYNSSVLGSSYMRSNYGWYLAGIDVDIDVEHEGSRSKVNPTPPPSGGPSSNQSDGSSGASGKPVGRGTGGGPGSHSSVSSTSEGAKVCVLYIPLTCLLLSVHSC